MHVKYSQILTLLKEAETTFVLYTHFLVQWLGVKVGWGVERGWGGKRNHRRRTASSPILWMVKEEACLVSGGVSMMAVMRSSSKSSWATSRR